MAPRILPRHLTFERLNAGEEVAITGQPEVSDVVTFSQDEPAVEGSLATMETAAETRNALMYDPQYQLLRTGLDQTLDGGADNPALVEYGGPTTTTPEPQDDNGPDSGTTTTTIPDSDPSPDTTRPGVPEGGDESQDGGLDFAGAVALAARSAAADGPLKFGDAVGLAILAASYVGGRAAANIWSATQPGTTIPSSDNPYDDRSIDATGKYHGDLLTAEELRNLSDQELEDFLDALETSVEERLRVGIELGFDKGHSVRLEQEREQIAMIESILEGRRDDAPGGDIDD